MQKNDKANEEKLNSPPKFYLEIEGDRVLKCYLSGAVGVRELTDDGIGILLKNGAINIEGKRLNMSLYDNNCLEIEGNISNINVKYKAKKERKIYAD